jgi:hypothetical protein
VSNLPTDASGLSNLNFMFVLSSTLKFSRPGSAVDSCAWIWKAWSRHIRDNLCQGRKSYCGGYFQEVSCGFIGDLSFSCFLFLQSWGGFCCKSLHRTAKFAWIQTCFSKASWNRWASWMRVLCQSHFNYVAFWFVRATH